jgi:hypothetical protein
MKPSTTQKLKGDEMKHYSFPDKRVTDRASILFKIYHGKEVGPETFSRLSEDISSRWLKLARFTMREEAEALEYAVRRIGDEIRKPWPVLPEPSVLQRDKPTQSDERLEICNPNNTK